MTTSDDDDHDQREERSDEMREDTKGEPKK